MKKFKFILSLSIATAGIHANAKQTAHCEGAFYPINGGGTYGNFDTTGKVTIDLFEEETSLGSTLHYAVINAKNDPRNIGVTIKDYVISGFIKRSHLNYPNSGDVFYVFANEDEEEIRLYDRRFYFFIDDYESFGYYRGSSVFEYIEDGVTYKFRPANFGCMKL